MHRDDVGSQVLSWLSEHYGMNMDEEYFTSCYTFGTFWRPDNVLKSASKFLRKGKGALSSSALMKWSGWLEL